MNKVLTVHLIFDLSQTDEVHAKDNTRPGANTPGAVWFDLLIRSRKYILQFDPPATPVTIHAT